MAGPSTIPNRALGRMARAGRFRRIAVIGSTETARALAAELQLANRVRCEVVGLIAMDPGATGEPGLPVLGAVEALDSVVVSHRIDLIVLSGEAPRVEIFDRAIGQSEVAIKICDLADFYEAVFGHVPTAEINACWFEYLVHPAHREAVRLKRALDLVAAMTLGLLLLPVMLALALIIRADGGPALFRQVRIGERGRPITVCKLRTMRAAGVAAAQWSSADDPRVTWIGRHLRRTHLDELPQLINVLRGEMSLVGPRPEQPEFVRRLEQALPFYRRRHMIKPGITGWAQIRCGYAGSDVGSAWKLCHDLYYMKYRSLRFDLSIMVRTALGTVFGPDHEVDPKPEAVFVATAAMPSPAAVVPGLAGAAALGLVDPGELAIEPRISVGGPRYVAAPRLERESVAARRN